MDSSTVQAVQVTCLLVCSEKLKRKKKRLWRKTWIEGHGEQGPSVLHKALEMHDRRGFRELLRMTAEEFDELLGMVRPVITKQNTKLRRAISPEERLALTLRFLATGETFKSLSLQYRIGHSTVSKIIIETCTALHQVMKEDFLRTPLKEEEWKKIAQEFEEKWHFPHCLGALDGKRINIQLPAKSGNLHYDYKGQFSVAIMAIIDANYKFLYAGVSMQDQASDAGLFMHSDLRKAMDKDLLNFPLPEPLANTHTTMPYMFLGDEAYPLRRDLMKPYPCRQTDRSQRIFNFRLSRARRVAENAFGILANRMRVFRSTMCLEPNKVVRTTMASLCIHNFLLGCRSEVYTPPAFADWENADHSIVEGEWRRQGMGGFHPVCPVNRDSASAIATSQRGHLRDYFASPAGCVPWQEEGI